MLNRKTYEKRFRLEDFLSMVINLGDHDGRTLSLRQELIDRTIGQKALDDCDPDFWGVVFDSQTVEIDGAEIVVTLTWDEDEEVRVAPILVTQCFERGQNTDWSLTGAVTHGSDDGAQTRCGAVIKGFDEGWLSQPAHRHVTCENCQALFLIEKVVTSDERT